MSNILRLGVVHNNVVTMANQVVIREEFSTCVKGVIVRYQVGKTSTGTFFRCVLNPGLKTEFISSWFQDAKQLRRVIEKRIDKLP